MADEKPKLPRIGPFGAGCITLVVVVLLAAAVAVMPFITVILLLNMIYNRGRINFKPARKKRVEPQLQQQPEPTKPYKKFALNFDNNGN